MTKTGRVTKIEGSRVTLMVQPSLSCQGCGRHFCGARGREIGARNSTGLPLKTGDYAEFSFPAFGALKAGLRVFGLPVLGFAVSYFMGGYIFETSEELPRALSGFAGFSASTLFAFFWGKNYARLPGIVRVRGAAEPVGPAEESPPEECPERTAG